MRGKLLTSTWTHGHFMRPQVARAILNLASGRSQARQLWSSSSQGVSHNRSVVCKMMHISHNQRTYSAGLGPSPPSLTASDLTIQDYHQVSDITLHELTDAIERLVESDHPQVAGWDVDYSSGVLTFSLGGRGTYVVNKQPPNKQIWLSSPFSGPKRFDYDANSQCWFYSRDGTRLKQLFCDEIDNVLGNDYFSKMLSSS